MKINNTCTLLFVLGLAASTLQTVAQNNRSLKNFREPGFEGLNQFETPKDTGESKFNGVKVRVGGDFALQFQALDHTTGSTDTLATLGQNFNLPTANLNVDVQLADGVRMSLVTYLSSRHHPEAWVKGGYVQVDKLDFIKEGLLENVMKKLTIKTGLDEFNYGDAHFRRSDNARAIYNPFVGNYIMDAFVTEAFGEVTFRHNGIIVVGGITNGQLNQSVVKGDNNYQLSPYGKIGYDQQFTDDFRFRLTGSFYISPGYDNGHRLYAGDRTGARYYHVMEAQNSSDDFRSGRFSPGFRKYNAFQINPFVKFKGVEFFGVYEVAAGDQSETATGGTYSQIGAELLYRIGEKERFYVGGRYNMVTGQDTSNADIKTIDRINVGGGWFMTDNILVKAEYVQQKYSGDGWKGSLFEGGAFSGGVLEAVISF